MRGTRILAPAPLLALGRRPRRTTGDGRRKGLSITTPDNSDPTDGGHLPGHRGRPADYRQLGEPFGPGDPYGMNAPYGAHETNASGGPRPAEGSMANAIRADYRDIEPGHESEMAYGLWAEARSVQESVRDLEPTFIELCTWIKDAKNRRAAQKLAAYLSIARDLLDGQADEIAAISEIEKRLGAALDPGVLGADVVADARIRLANVRDILETTEKSVRDQVKIGDLAVERISVFAEAEMLQQEITRDLGRWEDGGRALEVGGGELGAGGVAALDAKLARLDEIHLPIVDTGIAGTIAELTAWRDRLAARGGDPLENDDDDFTI